MKKLLSILGSVAITGTAGFSVVSCTEHKTTPNKPILVDATDADYGDALLLYWTAKLRQQPIRLTKDMNNQISGEMILKYFLDGINNDLIKKLIINKKTDNFNLLKLNFQGIKNETIFKVNDSVQISFSYGVSSTLQIPVFHLAPAIATDSDYLQLFPFATIKSLFPDAEHDFVTKTAIINSFQTIFEQATEFVNTVFAKKYDVTNYDQHKWSITVKDKATGQDFDKYRIGMHVLVDVWYGTQHHQLDLPVVQSQATNQQILSVIKNYLANNIVNNNRWVLDHDQKEISSNLILQKLTDLKNRINFFESITDSKLKDLDFTNFNSQNLNFEVKDNNTKQMKPGDTMTIVISYGANNDVAHSELHNIQIVYPSASDEQLATAVNNYLTAHPIVLNIGHNGIDEAALASEIKTQVPKTATQLVGDLDFANYDWTKIDLVPAANQKHFLPKTVVNFQAKYNGKLCKQSFPITLKETSGDDIYLKTFDKTQLPAFGPTHNREYTTKSEIINQIMPLIQVSPEVMAQKLGNGYDITGYNPSQWIVDVKSTKPEADQNRFVAGEPIEITVTYGNSQSTFVTQITKMKATAQDVISAISSYMDNNVLKDNIWNISNGSDFTTVGEVNNQLQALKQRGDFFKNISTDSPLSYLDFTEFNPNNLNFVVKKTNGSDQTIHKGDTLEITMNYQSGTDNVQKVWPVITAKHSVANNQQFANAILNSILDAGKTYFVSQSGITGDILKQMIMSHLPKDNSKLVGPFDFSNYKVTNAKIVLLDSGGKTYKPHDQVKFVVQYNDGTSLTGILKLGAVADDQDYLTLFPEDQVPSFHALPNQNFISRDDILKTLQKLTAISKEEAALKLNQLDTSSYNQNDWKVSVVNDKGQSVDKFAYGEVVTIDISYHTAHLTLHTSVLQNKATAQDAIDALQYYLQTQVLKNHEWIIKSGQATTSSREITDKLKKAIVNPAALQTFPLDSPLRYLDYSGINLKNLSFEINAKDSCRISSGDYLSIKMTLNDQHQVASTIIDNVHARYIAATDNQILQAIIDYLNQKKLTINIPSTGYTYEELVTKINQEIKITQSNLSAPYDFSGFNPNDVKIDINHQSRYLPGTNIKLTVTYNKETTAGPNMTTVLPTNDLSNFKLKDIVVEQNGVELKTVGELKQHIRSLYAKLLDEQLSPNITEQDIIVTLKTDDGQVLDSDNSLISQINSRTINAELTSANNNLVVGASLDNHFRLVLGDLNKLQKILNGKNISVWNIDPKQDADLSVMKDAVYKEIIKSGFWPYNDKNINDYLTITIDNSNSIQPGAQIIFTVIPKNMPDFIGDKIQFIWTSDGILDFTNYKSGYTIKDKAVIINKTSLGTSTTENQKPTFDPLLKDIYWRALGGKVFKNQKVKLSYLHLDPSNLYKSLEGTITDQKNNLGLKIISDVFDTSSDGTKSEYVLYNTGLTNNKGIIPLSNKNTANITFGFVLVKLSYVVQNGIVNQNSVQFNIQDTYSLNVSNAHF